MTKLPLVVYKNGKRNVIGEAVVHDSGSIEGRVTAEIDLDTATQLGIVIGNVSGLSLGPFTEKK